MPRGRDIGALSLRLKNYIISQFNVLHGLFHAGNAAPSRLPAGYLLVAEALALRGRSQNSPFPSTECLWKLLAKRY